MVLTTALEDDMVSAWRLQLNRTLLITTLMLCMAGCLGTSTPSRYYVLTPLPTSETASQPQQPNLTVTIMPVEIPEYLDRPQIVTQTARNEVTFSRLHRWAEPLQENIQRVLAENLITLLATDRIYREPLPRPEGTDLQIRVSILRFECEEPNAATLVARWAVADAQYNKRVERIASYKESFSGEGYTPLVAAQSKTLAALSREIADAVTRLSAPIS